MPCHHNLEAYLHAWLDCSGLGAEPKAPLFPTIAVGSGRGVPRLPRRAITPRGAHAMVQRLDRRTPLDRRDVEAALASKGFRASGGDHRYFAHHTENGQKTSVWTNTSHASAHETLSNKLVGSAKQCGLTHAQFKQLVACPLTRAHTEKILVDGGQIKLR